MVAPYGSPLLGRLLVALLVLAAPAVAFLLIAGALAVDAGPFGWVVIVGAPLAMLGAGVVLFARSSSGRDATERGNEFA